MIVLDTHVKEITMTEIVRSLALFLIAGLAEIGGGWLVWQWLREGKVEPILTSAVTAIIINA